ncbi:acyl-CoA carboxylase subunit beta [Glycomyces sp. TRM65418]|uniref:acyl-CoA carboxylase subunit beta n=1 Tax=Glycomyces sp. TRM65418 TaxID=2867006 RepID=UPI001CE5EA06|nr:acyl-CoA carboxylase subunit beta [Glycomyces sp. TRM65418]MCC3764578.1 acyl-CoA carboxylase subunit beta [Glycomyces sp. TRM65418]QZD54242.1 acyl-CoA carboxylase subunit beta [Glycomyces sp. TRM65418]
MDFSGDYPAERTRIERGGAEKYHQAAAAAGKYHARERIRRLCDPDSFREDALWANPDPSLPADGVVVGTATVQGRPIRLVANDSTVKAGSWGARTVEKIIRTVEAAQLEQHPIVYLVDSAGARITDQVQLFPGRRGAGRIFHEQVRASGRIPQACALFGPSAAGGAYIPAFCDIVTMVDGNASMYLGSPRMVEMVTGEKTTLEDMGGARVHCEQSGVGHFLCRNEDEAIAAVRRWLSYLPSNWTQPAPVRAARPPLPVDLASVIPPSESAQFDMHDVIDGLVDRDSLLEVQARWAGELITAFARLDGRPVGIVANNSAVRGGVLFSDSADKAARFVNTCDAFNVPLLFLADVPGFMVGAAVEHGGIIRHGAKMIAAVAEATVPKVCVVVRKAYGAGLYAMAGPAFGSDAVLALPSARIAVMGAEAAVNAVYANKIAAIEDPAMRERFVADKRAEYEADVDLRRLAGELVVDDIVEPDALRDDLIARYRRLTHKDRRFSDRRHPITPV